MRMANEVIQGPVVPGCGVMLRLLKAKNQQQADRSIVPTRFQWFQQLCLILGVPQKSGSHRPQPLERTPLALEAWEQLSGSDEGGRVSVVLALCGDQTWRAWRVEAASSVLGMIQEENVVFVIDVSGSMQVYLEDVKSAVNLALVQQFHQMQRHFNLVTFTEGQIEFRDDLVPATPRNLEDAMRFCQHTQAGGGSNLAAAVRNAFRFKKAEAILVITDGKTEVSEDLLTQVKVHYLGHPRRAKVHTVGINCVPGRIKQRALQSLAHLTQGSFRSVCLEQDTFVPVAAGQKVKGIDLLDQQYVTTDEDTITDAVLEDPYSEDDRLQR
ncbi:unnamed protein product [Cladocopium goreaui]|uniref:von Willebrand factor A domain-containing protein 3A n=1 Tax=Cladocopium goreaui TaxID=2562237 RepID=A0A9P1BGD9_9DINO|nr:unnamed protein product [Cladocopium goreaui]